MTTGVHGCFNKDYSYLLIKWIFSFFLKIPMVFICLRASGSVFQEWGLVSETPCWHIVSLRNDDLISFWFLVFALRAGLYLFALIDLYMCIQRTYSTMSSNLSNLYFLKSREVWALYSASVMHLITLF